MSSLFKLRTLDGNREVIERVINLDYVNYIHVPYGTQQGQTILRMSHGADSTAHTYAVVETFEELCALRPDFHQTVGKDVVTRSEFGGLPAAVNANRVQTFRGVGSGAALVTFVDGSEQYFDAALAAQMMARDTA